MNSKSPPRPRNLTSGAPLAKSGKPGLAHGAKTGQANNQETHIATPSPAMSPTKKIPPPPPPRARQASAAAFLLVQTRKGSDEPLSSEMEVLGRDDELDTLIDPRELEDVPAVSRRRPSATDTDPDPNPEHALLLSVPKSRPSQATETPLIPLILVEEEHDTLDMQDLPEAVPTSRDPFVGQLLDDRYEILSVLSGGNMGIVYEARHKMIGRRLAIKILRQEFAKDAETTERFLIEAKAASLIHNKHVVDIIDFGKLPNDCAYLAMEYLDGAPLSYWIEKFRMMSLPMILSIAKQIAEGVGAAHDHGIVHRDLKPDNLILTAREGRNDFVTVLDFGVAKVTRMANKLTMAGTVYGTPHYMSPEQAGGKEVDARTDIYSVGVILYEMATGGVPFDGENPMIVMSKHLSQEPIAPSVVCDAADRTMPPDLEAIILKCMAKKMEERYQSMSELWNDLDLLEKNESPVASMRGMPSSQAFRTGKSQTISVPPPAPTRRSWTKPMLFAGAVLGVLSLVGVVGLRTPALFGISPDNSSARTVGGLPLASGAVAGNNENPANSAATPAPLASGDYVNVALILDPIDAHVFKGKDDLGMMPISVPVPKHGQVVLAIRREGFSPRKITLDSDSPRKVIRLYTLSNRGVPKTGSSGGHTPKSGDPKVKPPETGDPQTPETPKTPEIGKGDDLKDPFPTPDPPKPNDGF
jgi:eukaryotic-like serine/threonine-protein kinase